LKNLKAKCADLSRENLELQATMMYLKQKLCYYGIVCNVNTNQFIVSISKCENTYYYWDIWWFYH
jgi:hypothetical protein